MNNNQTNSTDPTIQTYIYALVDESTNIVVNTIVWDGGTGWTPPSGILAIRLTDEDYCGIGFTYDPETKTFSQPL